MAHLKFWDQISDPETSSDSYPLNRNKILTPEQFYNRQQRNKEVITIEVIVSYFHNFMAMFYLHIRFK